MGTVARGEGCTLPVGPTLAAPVLSAPPQGEQQDQPPQYSKERKCKLRMCPLGPWLATGLTPNSLVPTVHSCLIHSGFPFPFPPCLLKSFFPQCSINSQEPSDCIKLFQLSFFGTSEKWRHSFCPSPPSVYSLSIFHR